MSLSNKIKTKVQRIQSTKKITSAMEMVAASKMLKSQKRAFDSQTYLKCLLDIIIHIDNKNLKKIHPYFIRRRVTKKAYIVISTDRGLCNGLDNNLFFKVMKDINKSLNCGITSIFGTIGNKSKHFFTYNHNNKIFDSIIDLGDTPSLQDLLSIINHVVDLFNNKHVDQIFIAYNKFVNSINQKSSIERILPLIQEDYIINAPLSSHYIYEPNVSYLFKILLNSYIKTRVYQAVLENIACEQAARMLAMHNASSNAQEMINKLDLTYNKMRQASITNELSEIVAGAAAL